MWSEAARQPELHTSSGPGHAVEEELTGSREQEVVELLPDW